MDWISTDICEKILSNDKKYHFLEVVDRYIGYISAYKFKGTKTRLIIDVLQQYCEAYCGSPYFIISDGGPQFKNTNEAIYTWCIQADIGYKLSSAASGQLRMCSLVVFPVQSQGS